MLFNILYSANSAEERFVLICAVLLAVLIAIVMHELAHGYVALRQGDYTAKMQGRLTLNPFKHFDLLGFAMMLFAGFGWAKPVPINPYNFKKYRKGLFLVSIAGVVTNIILALIFFLIFVFVTPLFASNSLIYLFLFYFSLYSVSLNLSLAAFNLLPVFPLDGFRIIESFTRPYNKFCTFMRRYGTYIFFGLVALSYVASFLNLPWLDFISIYTSSIKNFILNLFYLIV